MCYNCWEDGPAAAYVNKTSEAVEYFAVSETIMTSNNNLYPRPVVASGHVFQRLSRETLLAYDSSYAVAQSGGVSLQTSSVYGRKAYNNKAKGRAAVKRHALEPAHRHCYITNREVTVNIDYPNYVDMKNKGPAGDIYCEHIVECYHKNVPCRYSGISRFYPDPFTPVASDMEADEPGLEE